jgi:hypothetical protein
MKLNNSRISSEQLVKIFNNTAEVKEIYLANNSVNDDVLYAISIGCRNLECLDISNFRICDSTTVGFFHISSGSCTRTIKKLILTGCHTLTDSNLVLMSENCPTLRTLICSRAFLIGDIGYDQLTRLNAVLRNLLLLDTLSVSHCWRITDAGFKVESPSRSLQSLDMLFCYQLSGAVVNYLIKLPGLKHVNLSHCREVPESARDRLRSLGITVE